MSSPSRTSSSASTACTRRLTFLPNPSLNPKEHPMHLPTIAGPRRRTRRALLAAVLPAVLAAIVLPAAAHAATVELGADGTLKYRAAVGEINGLIVSESGGSVAVQDKAGV